MIPIVQRRRILSSPPALLLGGRNELNQSLRPGDHASTRIRTFDAESDVDLWLDLRHRAFAKQRLGVGRWDRSDFAREFLHKPWWRADWMWFAERPVVGLNEPKESSIQTEVVGTVCMALRGVGETARPVVHWLCVLPTARRRGIAQALVNHLEAAAWQAGYREIWLETHVEWREAAAFYEALGYVLVTTANSAERPQQEQQQQQ